MLGTSFSIICLKEGSENLNLKKSNDAAIIEIQLTRNFFQNQIFGPYFFLLFGTTY